MSPGRDAGASADAAPGPVVLFDGVCNLCNRAVQFILDHERPGDAGPRLRFTALQSAPAAALLVDAFGAEHAQTLRVGATGAGDPSSLVLLEDGRGFTHSTAALRIARHLRAPYRWMHVFRIVPRPLRDLVYRFLANNRYRWFGKAEVCRIPTPELRSRFLA